MKNDMDTVNSVSSADTNTNADSKKNTTVTTIISNNNSKNNIKGNYPAEKSTKLTQSQISVALKVIDSYIKKNKSLPNI